MNLKVSEKDACIVLQDVRELIKDCLLPRITQLEEEVRLLREVCWPICQSLRETSQLTDITNKKKFLEILNSVEVEHLLNEKAKISKRPVEYSTHHLIEKFN